eukprot:jgi/Tetstr1/427554/TSEL_017680.t1
MASAPGRYFTAIPEKGGLSLHVEGRGAAQSVTVPGRFNSVGYTNQAAVVPAPEGEPNEEQAAVLQLAVAKRHNIFLSGPAGTGKSFLLKHIQAGLAATLSADRMHLTAPTGIAAVNIGGSTIHSFAGIGLGRGKPEVIISKVLQNSKTVRRWREAEVLILDEVSMVSADMFDLLDRVGKAARRSDAPFGGVQLILCGDFFQLGPVQHRAGREFAFESDAWPTAVHHHVVLSRVMRQKGDTALIDVLNEVRWGALSAASLTALGSCHRPLPNNNGILPTRLYCTNKDVDKENATELDRLPGETLLYRAEAAGGGPAADMLERSCPAPAELRLKRGAQVVLLKRLDAQLVNGSRGVVVGVEPDTNWPRVRFDNGAVRALEPARWTKFAGNEAASRTQIPLKLAWALTVHRAQGMTLDRVQCVVGDAFAAGQIYVALSRARSFAGLELRGFNPAKVRASPKVIAFYRDRCGVAGPTASQPASALGNKTPERPAEQAATKRLPASFNQPAVANGKTHHGAPAGTKRQKTSPPSAEGAPGNLIRWMETAKRPTTGPAHQRRPQHGHSSAQRSNFHARGSHRLEQATGARCAALSLTSAAE